MQIALDLERQATAAGVLLFVDTDSRLKGYGVKLLEKNPELRAKLIQHHAAIRDLILSRSL